MKFLQSSAATKKGEMNSGAKGLIVQGWERRGIRPPIRASPRGRIKRWGRRVFARTRQLALGRRAGRPSPMAVGRLLRRHVTSEVTGDEYAPVPGPPQSVSELNGDNDDRIRIRTPDCA